MTKTSSHENRERIAPAPRHPAQTMTHIVHLTASVLPVSLLILAYYVIRWDSVNSLVAAVDHSPLFQDFLGYYYPMGKIILHASAPIYGYFYSAFSALLLAPLGVLDVTLAMCGWGIIQAISATALYIFPLLGLVRLKPFETALYTGVFLTSFPLLHNTKWGQMSVLLTACVILAFHTYQKKRRVLTGILIAFAASVKYYPAIFILYFILKRDLDVCITFIIAVILFYIFFPALVMGPHSWISFESARAASMSNAEFAQDVNSQYFAHVIARWSHIIFGTQQPVQPTNHTLTFVSLVILAWHATLLWMIQNRKSQDQNMLAVVLLFLSLPFAIKTSWPHYLVYLPFCQIAIITHVISDRHASALWKISILVLALLSIICSSVFAFDAFPHWFAYSASGMVFWANAILVVCFYLVAWKKVGMRTPA